MPKVTIKLIKLSTEERFLKPEISSSEIIYHNFVFKTKMLMNNHENYQI